MARRPWCGIWPAVFGELDLQERQELLKSERETKRNAMDSQHVPERLEQIGRQDNRTTAWAYLDVLECLRSSVRRGKKRVWQARVVRLECLVDS